MQLRKDPLVKHQIYHVFNRSIAGFRIFNRDRDYLRMQMMIRVYQFLNFNEKFSDFENYSEVAKDGIIRDLNTDGERMIDIIAYCIMPTHIHLILKQLTDDGISKFMSKILNSYAKYFNTKYKRSGHLWSGKFKSVLVEDDEQLLHLTRYIHLNPTSAKLVDDPREWGFSSYHEYINPDNNKRNISKSEGLFDIDPKEYKKFVDDRKSYQIKLSEIKALLMDDYTG
jgi:putative transposase